jgi:CheY-like chemotaxis protein
MARILVVDDSVSLRLVLTAVLHDAGHEVQQADDGVAALEDITTVPPDLVLSDIHMPRLDGLSLLQEARTIVPAVRWIIMSGTRRRPADLPVPFLAKPFDFDELLALISRVLVT